MSFKSTKMFGKKELISIILKNLAKAIASVAIASLIIFFFSQKIITVGNSLTEKRIETFRMERLGDIILNLKKDFEAARDGKEKIEKAFPEARNILPFVSAIEDLAKEAQLEQTISFETPKETADNLYEVKYSIKLKATISELSGYLKSFESLPYFTNISSVSLLAQKEVGWENDSTIVMQAKLYVR